MMSTQKVIKFFNEECSNWSAQDAYWTIRNSIDAGDMYHAALVYQAWTKTFDYDSRSAKWRFGRLWNMGIRAESVFQAPYKLSYL